MANTPAPSITWAKALTRIGQLTVFFSLLGALLFSVAGRLDWWEAWIFLVIYFVITVAGQLWIMYRDPALAHERTRFGPNIKSWDKVIVAINLLLTVALFVAIGLDAGRFQWSPVPAAVRAAAGLAFLGSISLTLWAAYVNTYLAGQVRIQVERGHHAITTGPYHYVRHPMYVSMILYDVSVPLLLGSVWAVSLGACMIIITVIRTALEDRALQAELPGYAEYTRQTRYRLLPGVW